MCERKSSSSLGGGVSPNTSSLPPGSRGGSGLLSSSSGHSSSPRPERRRRPSGLAMKGSGGSESARPWGDPAEVAAGMEQASSGAEPPGTDLLPSLARPGSSACEVEEAYASGLAAAAAVRVRHSGVTGGP
ncbi:hypothetical protein HJG60_010653 [Phyllostomus discolor]|uniref:Uncharacterized protein n=1 Tax=Phyllostomus discolor TaxID=89673 RepID=A0A834APT2_9CHIR|nr:hypothetical protein HJG60_010653 [Phyllostomus discolor]